jgi:hypothetical protein
VSAGGRCGRALIAVVSLTLLVSAPATAQAPTRGEWVDGANEICAGIVDRNVVLFDKFEILFGEGRYKAASKVLTKVFARAEGAFAEIGELPRPPAEAAAIGRFVRGELRSFDATDAVAEALAAGRIAAYERKFDRAAKIDRQAQREVRGFKPKVCFSKDEGEV